MSDDKPTGKPVVKVKPTSYQPSKAELGADASIPADPEHLARCLMQSVTVKTTNEPG